MNKKIVGKLGEDIAREYLKGKGYRIIEQNYRTRYGEIDLIAQKENTLVLVEVRTKTGEQFGKPEETLKKRKIKKFKMNALAYISKKGWKGAFRMDAICIVLEKNQRLARLNHYQNLVA